MKTVRRDDLLVSTKDKAVQAIKAGKQDEAIKLVEELALQMKPVHDRYNEWIQCLLNFVSEKLGEEAVEGALQRTFKDVYGPKLVGTGWKPKEMTPEEQVKFWVRANQCHFSDFYIEEDDEKFTMVIPFCGSGGKMHDEGKPGKTRKAYPWSFNQEGVEYYCCHEPVFESEVVKAGLAPEHHEYSTVYDKEGKPVGHKCKWIAYKKKPDTK